MLKRYIHSTIIFVVLSIPSVILIRNLFEGPDPDGFLTYFIEQFFSDTGVIEFGYAIADVASEMFIMITWLNVWLLALAYIYIIILDTINISLHWLIKSGIFVGLIILINLFFLNSTAFVGSHYISTTGAYLITTYTTIYYLTMFLIILVVKNWLSKKHA